MFIKSSLLVLLFKVVSEVSKPVSETKKEAPCVRNTTSSGGLDADDTEQLDFEAEEKVRCLIKSELLLLILVTAFHGSCVVLQCLLS